MEDFRAYSPEDVIYANLRETGERIDMICEQELAHLRELAAEITKDIEDDPELAASLPELFPKTAEPVFEGLTQNADALRGIRPFRTAWQHFRLCSEVCRRMREKKPIRPEVFFPEPDELAENALERIAYQRSSYADTAYLRFADLLSIPRAVYTHSFPAACEEVYNGLCEYCLLPLENSSEGPLNSFTRLIDRYELKIAATCDVTAADGSRTTRFALVRRQLVPIAYGEEREERRFELSLPPDASPSVPILLCVAELCGLTLSRLDSRPHPTEREPRIHTHMTFDTQNGDLPTFLLYLLTQAPESEHVGYYPHLK